MNSIPTRKPDRLTPTAMLIAALLLLWGLMSLIPGFLSSSPPPAMVYLLLASVTGLTGAACMALHELGRTF